MRDISFCLLIIVLFCSPGRLFGQDPIYSQFYASPILINPAFAGTSHHPVVYSHYRNQWPSIDQAYTTFSVTVDQFSDSNNSGYGFSLLSDNSGNGILRTIKAAGVYSYALKMQNDFTLRIGLEPAIIQSRLDWDRLIFSDQIDPITGPITQGGTVLPGSEIRPQELTDYSFDLSTGFLLSSPYFYAGLSLEHLNNPNPGFLDSTGDFVGIPTRYSLHFGTQINFDFRNKVDKGSFITPNALLVKQGDFYQVNLGFYSKISALLTGVWLRHTFNNADALIFSVGTKYEDFKIQYSFDYTVSDLNINSGGAHEISFRYIISSVGTKESKINDCLSIFR